MPVIQVLPQSIANQIAAGEVVERPSSVVKELVENAVDAHANCITVEIENGGLDCIRVTDNGSGIAADDAETAFLRHATSKICATEDLFRIGTLGFRGEALASIAAVSRIILTTCAENEEIGTRLIMEDGEVLETSVCGCAKGTSMEVRNLFSSVPARLKFIKSPRTEAGYIADYFSRMMLSRPDIAFTYRSNGKTVYQTFGDGRLYNVLVSVYGTGVAPHIAEVSYDDGYLALKGYVGDAEMSKPNRSGQSYFINGRYIRSNVLSAALMRAYDTRLMSGRFPFAVLSFSMAPTDVDVNVHPTKMEVRFLDEARVSRTLTAAVSRALLAPKLPDDVRRPPQMKPEETADRAGNAADGREDPFETIVLPPRVELRGPQPATRTTVHENTGYANVARPSGMVGAIQRYTIKPQTQDVRMQQPPTRIEQPALTEDPYTIVGVLFNAYWIVQQGESVFYIDQHAAHERRLYEKLMAHEEAIVSQKLLIPHTITLEPLAFETLREKLPLISALGYDITLSDTGCECELNAVAQVRGEALSDRFLLDALEQLATLNHTSDRELIRSTLIQAACKHAIKAGERIDRAEIEELLAYFKKDGAPLTCPHGRPILVRMTKLEIEKLFKRVL